MAHQVSHTEISPKKRAKRKKNGEPIKKAKGNISKSSEQQYQRNTIKFANWVKATYGVRDFSDCKPYIQSYCDYLASTGKSASTIHTYIAAPCRYFDVHMEDIEKPLRYCSENKRSRGTPKADSRKNAKREASHRLWDFASVVGVRRNEYRRLRRNDLVVDESGYTCVRVTRGKGGKFQLQRVLPEDEEFIRAYFDNSESYVFSEEEMANKQDLHSLRAAQARRAYEYYLGRIEAEGREKLVQELKSRWELYCNKKWEYKLVKQKPYLLRGKNREFAEKHGLPVQYDRLALLAVSVFHLSHWRLGVTVNNYLLAV